MVTEKCIVCHEAKARGDWGERYMNHYSTEDCAIPPKGGGLRKLPGLWDMHRLTAIGF